jgi:alpha-mannosidase
MTTKMVCFGLAACLFAVPVSAAQGIQGSWQTLVQELRATLRCVIHVSQTGSGLAATLDYPDRFEFGTAVDAISFDSPILKFRVGLVSFEGTLSADARAMQGTWSLGAEKQSVAWSRARKSDSNSVESVALSLKSLMTLPAGEWKTHLGDTPRGESTDFNDSEWQVVRPNEVSLHEAVWYRRWIEIPKTLNGYDLTGSKIWFDFQVDANGPVTQIIYFNGRRVAMGDNLEPIILFDSAQPGDKVLVAVKLLETVDEKHFRNANLRIDFPSSRPSPAQLFQEMGTVSILLPSEEGSQAGRSALAQAAAAVDLHALDKSDQKAFDASLIQARTLIEPLKPNLQQTSVRLTGNSHIDAAWLWPWTDTVDVARRTFETSLQLMEEYPQYTYTQSAAAYSDWIFQKYPSLHQQILNRVKQGRWEMVGGMWVEPDLNMPDGESLVRQLLIGKRYFKDKFGTEVRIGWNPDSFGYTWQLPQIYKKSGIDYFVTQKLAWNDSNQLPMKMFWWQSPDGSRVLTYFPHDYDNDAEPLKIAREVLQAQGVNPGMPEMMHLFGVGDHGGGPTRATLDQGEVLSNPSTIFPKTSFGIAQSFFSDVETKADTAHSPVWNYKTLATSNSELPAPPPGKFSLPIWSDELYFEYHRGVFTSQANHKQNMRRSEEQVLNAEKYSSLAWLFGGSYPATELTQAWKKVLFNQFHDLAAGSGVATIYQDAQLDYDDVRLASEKVTAEALRTISSRIDSTAPADGTSLLIVNPLAWQRTDLVSVHLQMPQLKTPQLSVFNSRNEPLPFQILAHDAATNSYQLLIEAKDIPSLGYEVLHVVPGGKNAATDLSAEDATAHGLAIENALLRVTVDPKTGCITSLFDKVSKFESIASAGCGNELIAFQDTPRDYDAWNIDANFADHFTKLDMVDSVELVEKGPLRATIRVMRNWGKSKFVQDISIYAGLNRVDVLNKIDWNESHVLLKAAFPLTASSNAATFEIAYGSIERPTTRDNRVDAAKFEVPALRWADLGDKNHGFSLINESKYGYDAVGNVLRISLLRSPTWPDPTADRGRHEFSYSLYPHAGNWKQALTARRGYEFNYKLFAQQVQPHQGPMTARHSFVDLTPDHVILTAMKKTEDGNGLLLRFFDWAGTAGDVHITVPRGATSATLTNLMEQPEGSMLRVKDAEQIVVPVYPYEIVSVRVNYDRGLPPE